MKKKTKNPTIELNVPLEWFKKLEVVSNAYAKNPNESSKNFLLGYLQSVGSIISQFYKDR